MKAYETSCWWKLKEGEYHRGIDATMTFLQDQHRGRQEAFNIYAQQYGHELISDLSPYGYRREDYLKSNILHYNLIGSMTDAATALLAKEQRRIRILTERGRVKQQFDAQQLEQFIYGLWQMEGVYKNQTSVIRNGALIGTAGYIVTVSEEGGLRIDPFWQGEIFYDKAEAFHGKPRSMYWRRAMPREQAIATWPDKAEELRKAKCYENSGHRMGARDTGEQDVIEIWNAWHLPSFRGAGDGVWAVATDTCDLDSAEWVFDFFPKASFSYRPPIYGVEGEGIASMIGGLHCGLNEHLETIQDSLLLISQPKIIVDDNAQVVLSHLDDQIGAIIRGDYVSGKMPVFHTPSVLNPEWLNFALWHVSAAENILGMSEIVSSGSAPKYASGNAQEQLMDQALGRQAPPLRAVDEMFLDLAKICVSMASEYWKSGVPVRVRGRDFLQTINFRDIELPQDSYEMTVMPASMLPMQPGARYATVRGWIADEMISREEGMQLLDFPDLAKKTRQKAAPRNDIDRTIERMLFAEPPVEAMDEDDQKRFKSADSDLKETILAKYAYLPPERDQDFRYGIEACLLKMAEVRHSDVHPARRKNLLKWVAAAERLMTSLSGPAGGPQPVAQGGANPLPEGVLTAPNQGGLPAVPQGVPIAPPAQGLGV